MDLGLTITIGFLIGCLIMTLGGGGGAFYLGALTTIFGLDAATAASTSLVTSLLPLMVGVYSYYRNHKINFKVGWRMLGFSIPAVIVGSISAHFIPERMYSIIVGVILLAIGVQLVYKTFRKRKPSKKRKNSKVIPAVFGVLGGLMCGIGGLSGGGAVMGGLLFMDLDFTNVVATSGFILSGMSIVGVLCHLTGTIAWADGIGLMIGALIGATVMPYVLSHLNQAKLNHYMNPFIGFLIIFMALSNIF